MEARTLLDVISAAEMIALQEELKKLKEQENPIRQTDII